jgi:mono/diheme cytochrome c family protein
MLVTHPGYYAGTWLQFCYAQANLPSAQSPAAQRGLTFVRVHCAQCHAIDRVSDSPLAIAPPFRTLLAISPVGLTRRRPVSPPASSKGSMRC